jgi:hypothetical protein
MTELVQTTMRRITFVQGGKKIEQEHTFTHEPMDTLEGVVCRHCRMVTNGDLYCVPWPCPTVRDAELCEIIELMDIDGERQGIKDYRDTHVRIMCEEYGYGAVMDSAARQWREKDPIGAFMVGPCVALIRKVMR